MTEKQKIQRNLWKTIHLKQYHTLQDKKIGNTKQLTNKKHKIQYYLVYCSKLTIILSKNISNFIFYLYLLLEIKYFEQKCILKF